MGSARPGLHLTRSLFGVLSMGLSFLSLRFLPVAQAEALAYLAPVFSLVLASVLLSERVGLRAMLAVGLGLAGVIVLTGAAALRPGQGALIGIAAGLGYALTSAFVRVHVKSMTATERPETIAIWFAVTGFAVGLATLPFASAGMSVQTWALLALAGVLGAAGHILAALSLRMGTVSQLAPLDFTGIGWAVAFDIVIFGARPTAPVAAGLALIVMAAWMVRVRPASATR